MLQALRESQAGPCPPSGGWGLFGASYVPPPTGHLHQRYLHADNYVDDLLQGRTAQCVSVLQRAGGRVGGDVACFPLTLSTGWLCTDLGGPICPVGPASRLLQGTLSTTCSDFVVCCAREPPHFAALRWDSLV